MEVNKPHGIHHLKDLFICLFIYLKDNRNIFMVLSRKVNFSE